MKSLPHPNVCQHPDGVLVRIKRGAVLFPSKPPLWKNNPAMLDVFARIAAERDRQRQLIHAGKITFDCASVIPDPNRKLRVLTEEVGEVAQELDRLENCKDRRGERFVLEDLETELVQVAAVAVAWLESLQKGGAR